ncbi:MAG: amidophosphoribosyltransferase [Chloroflexi bacterium UTCFX4]|nr:MAG: amidophosphoribosyltransferase [Chloroflexi bacterium UTCFX4]
MIEYDKPLEECGVIGVFAPNEDVARMIFFGLYALQHRGQEAAGIAVSDGGAMRLHKDAGLVAQVFHSENLAQLEGHYAIGHTRYSTTGSSHRRNAQPFMVETFHGPLAVAHNGNLVNASELRQNVLQRGVGLSSSSDSEVMLLMLAGAEGDTWEERIANTMPQWHGAYSLVILTRNHVFAVRDPWGFRPLSVGRLPSGGHAAASETGALKTLGCDEIREVKPGEIVTLSNTVLRFRQGMMPMPQLARCIFEHIYFSRPDSFWDGQRVHNVRQRLGEELAREAPLEADVVVPVPDSSMPAAIGYARESKIPYNEGFTKNRYIARTFIQPTDSLRKQGIALKFNALEENLRGQRVVMIDDSIVRGNTSGPLVKLLRSAGAREVHVCITCPPIAHPCYMGVDMGTYDEMIAHKLTVEEIRDYIGADSLHFLSVEGMMRAVGRREGYCNACFTGVYPLEIDRAHVKTGFERALAG